MVITSYCLSLAATVLGFFEPFWKKMQTILIFNFLGNLLVGISYLLIGGYSGAGICAVACGQVFVNYFFDVKEKKVPSWLIAIYAIAFLSVNLSTFFHWYDGFSLVAAMLFVLSVAQSNAKNYRLLYAANSLVWIFYDIFAAAYGNLATHGILLLSTFLAMWMRDKKKKA